MLQKYMYTSLRDCALIKRNENPYCLRPKYFDHKPWAVCGERKAPCLPIPGDPHSDNWLW